MTASEEPGFSPALGLTPVSHLVTCGHPFPLEFYRCKEMNSAKNPLSLEEDLNLSGLWLRGHCGGGGSHAVAPGSLGERVET